MAINFPSNPTDNQTYTNPNTGIVYVYNTTSTAWLVSSNNALGYTGSVGSSGPTGFTGSVGASANGFLGDQYYNNYTSLLLHFNGANGATKTYDSGPKGHNVTLLGSAVLSNTQARFGNTSLLTSNGTAGRLYTEVVNRGDPLDLATGNTDFTIEAWAYPRAIPASGANEFTATVVAWGPVGFGAGYAAVSIALSSGGLWTGQWNSDNTGPNDISITGGTATLNTWSHLALTRDGNVFRMFVNGSLISNTTSSAVTPRYSADRWVIGSGTNGTYKFDGFIDEVRVTKGIARYTSSFTAPTAEFPEFYSVPGFTGSAGTGYVGSRGTVVNATSQSFTANGTQNTFTLSNIITNGNNALVTVNGLLMTPIADYVINGGTLNMLFTPLANAEIEVRNLEGGAGGGGSISNKAFFYSTIIGG